MSLKIYAVGDIMLGEQHLCNNFGVKKTIRMNGPDYVLKKVSSIFLNGDIVFGNLECSINNFECEGKKSRFFCADPSALDTLKNGHFNVVSVANNHIMDNGRKFYIDTIQTLRNNDITPIGCLGKNEILNINGQRIAFLGYSFIEDNTINDCYNKVSSEEVIIEDIHKVRPNSDLVIVSLHWGCEYVPYPSINQVRIGRNLVDAGADIIIGGHPHVTQGYEIYKNRPIFYSLGNFIFDDTYIPSTRDTYIAEITISDSPELMDVNIIPVCIDKNDYQIQMLNPIQRDACLDTINKTRNKIENRTLSDYIDFSANYDGLCNSYKKKVNSNMKIQFIKNIHRYSLSTTTDIVRQFLRK